MKLLNYQDKTPYESEHTVQDAENVEQEDIERREKLRRWQACQVAKGFVDNTINKMLENFILPAESYSVEDPECRVFRGNDMENTAVMMAIRNHGLVQTADQGSQSDNFYNNETPWTNNDNTNVPCCPSSNVQETEDISNSIAASSTNSLKSNDPVEVPHCNGSTWDVGKIADNDQQEDFLERAVAEAIKKKGLSALSVDYG